MSWDGIDVRDLDLFLVSQTVFPNWIRPTPIVDHRTAGFRPSTDNFLVFWHFCVLILIPLTRLPLLVMSRV